MVISIKIIVLTFLFCLSVQIFPTNCDNDLELVDKQDSESTDVDESDTDDDDFQFETDKKSDENSNSDDLKSYYLSWSKFDLCKDVQCKPDQYCVIQSKSSVICANKKLSKFDGIKKKSPSIDWTKNSRSKYYFIDESKKLKQKLSDCRPCPGRQRPTFYCGSDNATYSSLCRLEFHNCLHDSDVRITCKGFCPCGGDVSPLQKAKEIRNHQRWNKYMENVSKARKDYKMQKYLRDRSNHIDNKKENNNNPIESNSNSVLINSGRELASSHVCSSEDLRITGERLISWFSVALSDQKRNPKKADFLTFPECSEDITRMFHHFDLNGNLKLSSKELYHLEYDNQEKCIKQYLDGCDDDRDFHLSPHEWCSCFDRKAQPCRQDRNRRRKLFSNYIPKCDLDGFYQPLQCLQGKKVCFCVDKYGVEMANSRRTTGIINCEEALRTGKIESETDDKESSSDFKNDQDSDDDEEYDDSDDGSGDSS
ncbi:proteoglycan Cow-like [Brevipalpus obovatus]|uniref:proteoglycan Cow-like n=1 Tax=Brevipalpus obovatus TaxID=246614 RepID=UPI003D9FA30E